jgi:methylthioribose-1-phosphate isomerase
LKEAQRIADEDVEINKRMAEHGATLIDDGDTVIHHCNTGALATVDWGTALGVIRTAWEQGKKIHVLVDETARAYRARA